MLFRPTFCAHCGDKIDRADWTIFTSRRFCAVCESEFKGFDLLPRAFVGLSLIALLFGTGSYMLSGANKNADLSARQLRGNVEPQRIANRQLPVSETAVNALPINAVPAPKANTMVPPKAQLTEPAAQVRLAATPEPVFICGAETKKGTPCSRRVKGNVRCFQHTGMPAMQSSDKLRMQ